MQIDQLPFKETPDGTEVLPVKDDGITKQISVSSILGIFRFINFLPIWRGDNQFKIATHPDQIANIEIILPPELPIGPPKTVQLSAEGFIQLVEDDGGGGGTIANWDALYEGENLWDQLY